MVSDRLVWFLLVNKEGDALTEASKVPIPTNSDVDDFKRAVKRQCDQEGDDLKGILASKLVIYANKAAFEAGNALSARDKIREELGRDDELYVVVPASRQNLAVSYQGTVLVYDFVIVNKCIALH